jgi:hypothetical protein
MDINQEQDYAQVYPFLLLHAAQLHPLDLRRQLANWRDRAGNVRVSLDRARSWRGYKYELLVQLAIECVLESEEFTSQFERDPAFRRLAYDALYYPSRLWDKGQTLDLRDSARAGFENYLLERMRSERRNEPGNQIDLDRLMTPNQRRLLFESVRRLARMLVGDGGWQEKFFRRRHLTSGVVDAVPAEPLLDEAPTGVFRWQFDRAGAALRENAASEATAQASGEENWRLDEEFILRTESVVQQMSGEPLTLRECADDFRLIGTSPVFSEMQAALGRLKQAAATGVQYDLHARDTAVVRDYANMLRRDTTSLGAGLLAACTCSLIDKRIPPSPVRFFLGTIRDLLRLDALSFIAGEERLCTVCEGLQQILPRLATIWDLEALYQETDLERWYPTVRATLEEKSLAVFDEKFVKARSEEGWRAWKQRLAADEFGADDPRGLASMVFCHVLWLGPAQMLEPDTRRMTVSAWSRVFAASLQQLAMTDKQICPRWLMWPSARALGWRYDEQRVRSELSLLRRTQDPAQASMASNDPWESDMVHPAFAEGPLLASIAIISKTRQVPTEYPPENWTPSTQVQAFLLDEKSMTSLLAYVEEHQLQSLLSGLIQFNLLAVEEPVSEGELKKWQDAVPPWSRPEKGLDVIGYRTPNSRPVYADYMINLSPTLETFVQDALRQINANRLTKSVPPG